MTEALQWLSFARDSTVFSADADFTPLLRKLRREDRRTTIFAAGATSASYDASADLIIDPEAFISGGLGFDEEDASFLQPNLASLIAQAEAVVWRTVDQATQPVSLPALTKALATQVPGLVQANWAGKGTFYGLLTSLPLEPLKIDRGMNALVDPRRLVGEQRKLRSVSEAPAATAEVAVASTASVVSKPAPEQAAFEEADVGAMLAQELAKSDRPVAVARLAQLARERFPGIEKNWLGQGTWKKLLDHLQSPKLKIVWENLVGYALDPTRHSLNFEKGREDGQASVAGAQSPLEVTTWLAAAGMPSLDRGFYRTLLEGLSSAMEVQPFSLAAYSGPT